MRILDDWLKAYMQYTMYSEAPEQFHFWTGISVIAAALRRKVWFDMLYWEWHPNFYIIFVAPPGIATKSTSMEMGKSLLTDVDGIKFGPSALTWPSLIQILEQANEAVLMPDGNFHHMSCLSFFVSEFGTLFDPQDRKMVDVLVDLWDGRKGVWEKSTIMRGAEKVANPWLNILAAVTPDWLSDNLPRTLIGGGFASRCIFVFAESKRAFIAYPKRQVTLDWIDKLGKNLRHDLECIAVLKGQFEMTEEAYQLGEKWYVQHWTKAMTSISTDKDITGYMARKQAHVHKIAMVLSAAKRDDLRITVEDFDAALKVSDFVEAGIPRVFHTITTSGVQDQAERILLYIKQKRSIEKTELYRVFFHTMSAVAFNDILTSAITAGYIQQRIGSNSVTVIDWVGPKEKPPVAVGVTA